MTVFHGYNDAGSEHREMFATVAAELVDHMPFVAASDGEAREIVLYRREDNQEMHFEVHGALDGAELRDWILANEQPRYHLADPIAMRNLSFLGRYTVMAFADLSKKSSLEALHSCLEAVVETAQSAGIDVIYASINVTTHREMAKGMGFSGDREPVYACFNVRGGSLADFQLFPEAQRASPTSALAWLQAFIEARTRRPVKSEVVENSTSKSPLRKVVGSQFRETMFDSETDEFVVVLHGTPAEKRKTRGIAERVAKAVSKARIEGIRFWHMDGDLNDVDGVRMEPTNKSFALLFPESDKRRPVLLDPTGSSALFEAIKANGGDRVREALDKVKVDL